MHFLNTFRWASLTEALGCSRPLLKQEEYLETFKVDDLRMKPFRTYFLMRVAPST